MKRYLAIVWLLASGWVVAEVVPPAERPAAALRAAAELPPVRASDTLNAILLAMKQNDFAALMEATDEDQDLGGIAAAWDERAERAKQRRAKANKQDPDALDLEAEGDDTMQDTWNKLLSDEGVDALVKEWQPKVAETASKRAMEFNLGFAALLADIAGDQKLNADQVQQLTRLMYAVQDWTGRVDFAEEARLRQALTAIAQLVRATRLKRFDEIETLRFEEAAIYGDELIRTVKRVLAAYDIDADAILNSVRIEEHDASGDRALLRVQGKVFGVDLAHERPMRYFKKRWMDADDAADIERWADEAAEAERAAAAAEAESADPATDRSERCVLPETEQ